VIGYQVRVLRFGYGFGPEPVPGAEHPNLEPEGRDPGPESDCLWWLSLSLPARMI